MPNGKNNESKLEHLAMHVACGGSVASFARDHEIPRRTAYLWTKSDGFSEKVADYRDRVIDRLVGRLAKLGGKAVQGIGVLAEKAESEAVRLQACRAVLSDLIGIGNYATNARQFEELKAQVKALEDAIANRSNQDAHK
jgi:hypothetical protein